MATEASGSDGAIRITGEQRFAPGAAASGQLDGWVIGMTLSGRVSYSLGQETIITGSYDVTLVRPRVPQRWVVPADCRGWTTVWCMFAPWAYWRPWLDWRDLGPKGRGWIHLRLAQAPHRHQLRQALRMTHQLARSGLPYAPELARTALESAILWCRTDAGPQQPRPGLDLRVAEAIEYMNRHLGERLRLHEIARACHLSRAHLALLFHRQMGVTPIAWLERLRMERARELLTMTTLPVKQIAFEVGYRDPKHFARRFRRHAGAAPSRLPRPQLIHR